MSTADSYIDQEAEEDSMQNEEEENGMNNDEDENDLLDEENDGDYAESPAKKKRKTQKKQKTAADYIETEAQVDEDNEEEDEEGEMDTDFIHPRDENEEVPSVAAQMANREKFKERDSIPSLFKRLEDKYVREGPQTAADEEEEEKGVEGGRRKQKSDLTYKFPSVDDPKLFRVKCVPGKEKDIVFVLLQKFYNLMKLKPEEQMQMTSAFCVPGVKGFIYVEAFLERHAKHAIHGVQLLMENSIKLVPMKEMDQVLNVERTKEVLKKDQWIRINKGSYKGDLGQIVLVDESRGSAFVRLIPRIEKPKSGGDEVTIDDAKDDDADSTDPSKKDKLKPKRKTERPPQMLFKEFKDRYLLGSSEEGDESANAQISKSQRDNRTGLSFEMYNGMRFKDGLLYKDISLKTLQTKEINPKYEEVELFRKALESSQETSKLFNSLSQHIRTEFKKGDLVKVIEGDLKSLIGKVIDVDSQHEMVQVIPDESHRLTNQILQFEPKQLQKYFPNGAYCKVVSGRHVGKFGYIVSTNDEEGEAILFVKQPNAALTDDEADAQSKTVEIRLFISELEMTSSASTANTTTNGGTPNGQKANARTFSQREPRPAFNSPRGGGGNFRGGRGGGAGKPGGRGFGPVGKSVRVLKGSFKGRIGICKYMGRDTIRIELHTIFKTIDMKFTKDYTEVCRIIEQDNASTNSVSSTNADSRQYQSYPAPMAGGETPAHASSTTPQRGVGGWGDTGNSAMDEDYRYSYTSDIQSVTTAHSSLSPLDGGSAATPYSSLSQGPQSVYSSSITPSVPITPGAGLHNPTTPGLNLGPTTPGIPMTPGLAPMTPGVTPYAPTTPGLHPVTPGLGASMMSSQAPTTPGLGMNMPPTTPGVSMSGYGMTPMMSATSPNLGPMTPGLPNYGAGTSGMAQTPGVAGTPYAPTTPGMTPYHSETPMVPQATTPGLPPMSGMQRSYNASSYWISKNACVTITAGPYKGQIGVISNFSVVSDELDVYLESMNKFIKLTKSQVARVSPQKGDKVKILSRGTLGQVKTIDETSICVGLFAGGVMFFDSTEDLVVFRDIQK